MLYQLSYTPTAAPFAATAAAMQAYANDACGATMRASPAFAPLSRAGAAKLGAERRWTSVELTGPSRMPAIGRRPGPC